MLPLLVVNKGAH